MNGWRCGAREPTVATGCAGNEGNNLDPQRQHAQLLTVWAQGNKIFRRWQHFRRDEYAPWSTFEMWWNLARRLTERGLVAQMFPGPGPIIVVGGLGRKQDQWLVLVTPEQYWPEVFSHLVVVHLQTPAMTWSDHISLSYDCAVRLGNRHWNVLLRLADKMAEDNGISWSSIHTAIDVLALIDREYGRLQPLCGKDLTPLAQLWRHRGVPQVVSGWTPEPGRYSWLRPIMTPKGPGYLWSNELARQDEDIVH